MYARVDSVQTVMEEVNQVGGECCACVGDVSPPKPWWCMEGRWYLHVLHNQVCDHYRHRLPHHCAMDLPVYFGFKGQVGQRPDLLQPCLEATYLAFEGKVYRQIHSTATVHPSGVIPFLLILLLIFPFLSLFSFIFIYLFYVL